MEDLRNLLRHYKLLTPLRFLVTVTATFISMLGMCLWMTLFLPLYWFWPEVYFLLCNHFRDVNCGYNGILFWFLGANIVEVGNVLGDILPDKSILMVNHQSVIDGPLLFAVMGKRGLGHTMGYLGDHWIKFTTNYGYCSMFARDVFINQKISDDKSESQLARITREVTSLFKSPSKRTWFMIFPEGGLLHKRRPKSQSYAKRNGFPVLQHVALPRKGAMKAIVEAYTQTFTIPKSEHENTIGDTEWKWIVDATIAYPDGKALPLSFMATGALSPCLITICYRIYPASEVPVDGESLQKWLFERYVEKDAMLEYFYRHGHFPEDYFTRNHDRPVRKRPQTISWNCYSAGLGYIMLGLVHFWSAIMVWDVIFNFTYNSIKQFTCVV